MDLIKFWHFTRRAELLACRLMEMRGHGSRKMKIKFEVRSTRNQHDGALAAPRCGWWSSAWQNPAKAPSLSAALRSSHQNDNLNLKVWNTGKR
jgi:hypothetical protein